MKQNPYFSGNEERPACVAKIWRVLCLAALLLVVGPLFASGAWAEQPLPSKPTIANVECLDCHGVKGFAVPTGAHGETPKKPLHVDGEMLQASIHGSFACLDCHGDIDKLPHAKDGLAKVDCISCHLKLTKESPDLIAHINLSRSMAGMIPSATPTPVRANRAADHYLDSIHAKKTKGKAEVNAQCKSCHGSHGVFKADDSHAKTHRLASPKTCGACHEKQLAVYQKSIHGASLKTPWKGDSAVCSDCHSAHQIASPKAFSARKIITKHCGNCHEKALAGYMSTYHGQVVWLGGDKVAKCFDCHRHHDTHRVDDPDALVHPDNRLKTCKGCHKDATAGFVGFHPHGNTHDFEKYPQMWLASKLMIGLLIGVFAFFWTHSALWFYREWHERQAKEGHVQLDSAGELIVIEEMETPREERHVRRFGWQWMLAHLLLSIAVMMLVLTGTAVLFAESFWAPVAIKLLGGPQSAAIIHRISAVVFALVFFGHIGVALYKTLIRNKKTFRWFGPYSLLPRWQDFHDLRAMFKWFFNKGPRPIFDYWTYWEKFDYWAPFWGMFIIGLSGLMMWFPAETARVLPGWVFNVATIVHGEEAFLAAVFLFTVHFFNCHFRPDKFPLDIVMFTGTLSMKEFRHEREVEYQRLLADGTLEHYLVPPPSKRAVLISRIVGFTLLFIGLILLLLVIIGFFRQGLF